MSKNEYSGETPRGFIKVTPDDDLGFVFIRSSLIHGILHVTEGPAVLGPTGESVIRYTNRVVGKMGGKQFSFAVKESMEELIEQLEDALPFDSLSLIFGDVNEEDLEEEGMKITKADDVN